MRHVFVAAFCVFLVASSACQRTATAPAPDAGKSPNPESSADPAHLAERTIHRRAVEAVIWGMPAVNFELMHDAATKLGGDWNHVVYWSRLPSWKNQTLTPNPDVIYLMPFYDTRGGPVVLEIPPAEAGSTITGSIDDGWQTALEDVGPAGVDKGKGGKYLILPPGHDGRVPAGYIPMPSSTYTGYALLRSNIGSGSDEDISKAAAYGRRIKIYPLSQAASPPETKFVDAIDADFDATIPYDMRFFEALQRFVDREPWIERDKAMIDPLRTLGIEKGKPFKPDATTERQLKEAIAEAHAWLQAKYEVAFEPYYPNARWAVPASPEAIEGLQTNYAKPDAYPVDARGLTYTYGFFSAKHLGQGQFYLMAIKDMDGKPFDGGSHYVLKVPANAPVSLYWSATAYDRATHALIRDQKWSSRASTTQGLKKNDDGSVDVHFGPKPPDAGESNWVPTRPDGQFEVLFRFYGPQKPLFDKAWVLPDLVKTQ
jgi:hypothetical protein